MTNRQKGFTLVEIIFSIAFLSIVSVVILQLFLTSNRVAEVAQQKNFATLYASNAIELAKAQADSGEMPLTKNATIEQYYDVFWRKQNTDSQAAYILKLTLTEHHRLKNLIYLDASVTTPAGEALAQISTAHYIEGRQ